jgi:hypothetical protein
MLDGPAATATDCALSKTQVIGGDFQPIPGVNDPSSPETFSRRQGSATKVAWKRSPGKGRTGSSRSAARQAMDFQQCRLLSVRWGLPLIRALRT